MKFLFIYEWCLSPFDSLKLLRYAASSQNKLSSLHKHPSHNEYMFFLDKECRNFLNGLCNRSFSFSEIGMNEYFPPFSHGRPRFPRIKPYSNCYLPHSIILIIKILQLEWNKVPPSEIALKNVIDYWFTVFQLFNKCLQKNSIAPIDH